MYCNIVINKENEGKLCIMKNAIDFENIIKLKCTYYMHRIAVIKHTFLSIDVVNIISEYVNDEIDVNINKNNNYTMNILLVAGSTNFINWRFFFWIKENNQMCAYISGNVLRMDNIYYPTFETDTCTYNIIERVIDGCINNNVQHTFLMNSDEGPIKFKIIDYDVMLIICNIMCTLKKYISNSHIKKN